MGKPVGVRMHSESLPKVNYCPVCHAEEGTEHDKDCAHYLRACNAALLTALEKVAEILSYHPDSVKGNVDEAIKLALDAIKVFRDADTSS